MTQDEVILKRRKPGASRTADDGGLDRNTAPAERSRSASRRVRIKRSSEHCDEDECTCTRPEPTDADESTRGEATGR